MKKSSWLIRGLFILIFIAVFGDFLANEKPIICKIDDAWHFPIFKQYAVTAGFTQWESKFVINSWNEQNYQFKILPPIPYSAHSQDRKNNNYVSPFEQQEVVSMRYWHWLGTDNIGRDVFAGMIAGTRTALIVGLIAMGIASFIGIFLGSLAGYFGDEHVRIPIVRFVLTIIGMVLGLFIVFIARAYILQTSSNVALEIFKNILFFLGIIFAFNGLGKLAARLPVFKREMYIPFDTIVMRLIELLRSIPGILILLAILSLIRKPSIVYVMMIIGFLAWTGIARFIRAELLRIRQLEYVNAARAIGLTEARILFRHAIPNALPPVLITIAFGIAAAILMEASLSYLGIGVSIEAVTWGSMLREGYGAISAWWVSIFPGLAIFATVTLFNLLGERMSRQKAT